jgi:hypothetical protein
MEGAGTQDYLEPYLAKAATWMFIKRLTELDIKQPYWRAISLLGRC